MAVRVAVVGAGAIGLGAAASAARLGGEVTVIERAYPASGSSGLSLGIFNRQTPSAQELELRIRSVEELARLELEADLPLERCGYIRLARRPGDIALFRETLELQRRLGYREARILDAEELERRVPDLETSDLFGALYGPSDGTFDGHLVCAAYQQEAEKLGVEVRVRSALLSAVLGEEIVLHTTSGDVRCDRVINAAGPWGEQVGETLGAPCPIVPQRHAVCVAKIGRELDYRVPTINEYMPGSGDYALVLRPEGSQRLLAMLHSHEVINANATDPDDYARGVGFDYVELVAERLARRLPGLADDLSLDAGWAGLYPVSPDNRFQVGPSVADSRVVVAGGVGGVGITVSAAVGQLAAEWAVLGRGELVSFADELRPGRASLHGVRAS